MIKKVRVTNYLGESITLELARPELSGFLVRKISGLGPSKSNINTTQIATMDGGKFNSAFMDVRNIVLDLIFLENPTIEDTRYLSYKYFPLKKEIKIDVFTDTREAEAIGHVESNDPEIFSQNGSDMEGTSISIICSDPYFYSIKGEGETKTILYGTTPLFEFPFENNSLTEKLIEFGEIHKDTRVGTINYEGDIETGFLIEIHAKGSISGLKIYNTDTREIMELDDDELERLTGSKIKAGDTVYINSERGNRYIHLLRDGIEINILNALKPPINWFYLRKGINNFACSVTSGLSNMDITITNRIVYEGM